VLAVHTHTSQHSFCPFANTTSGNREVRQGCWDDIQNVLASLENGGQLKKGRVRVLSSRGCERRRIPRSSAEDGVGWDEAEGLFARDPSYDFVRRESRGGNWGSHNNR
jgi:hypothetical protein